ncbi:hypothetical protein ANN_15779 [Periplaneta americana]|uniref:Uncharacterized protein n=1 Tax=Periplaneta americana TaxID=6978 RepID=A0ABQ8SIF1_PERAM|nr:hypothetical protein ANN_15779 [Periplaneta americana]
MSPGSNTVNYPAFAHIGLRENPGKNLNQVTCPDRESNPGHLVSRLDVLTVTPQRTHWLGHYLRRICLLKDELEGIVNGRRVRGRRRHQMIDDIKIYGSYAEAKRKADNRKDLRMLGLH